MKTGLSAGFYIKNNKKRICTLVMCVALFSAMLYITDFLFGISEESFRHLLVEQKESLQLIMPNQREESADFKTQLMEEADLLKQETFVEDAVPVGLSNMYLKSIIGQYPIDIYLAEQKYMKQFCEWNHVENYEGTLPKEPGDLLVTENMAKNIGLKVGQKVGNYTITAIGKSKDYSCFGIPTGNETGFGILVHAKGKDVDFKTVYQSYEDTIEPYLVSDYVSSKEEYETEIASTFQTASDMIANVGMVVLSICLVVLYILYIRERQEEWCLYQSIGYSSAEIYLCAVREMLFVFFTGICLAGVITIFAVILLDYMTVKPLGLLSVYVMTDKIFRIFCVLTGIFGLCNLPVFAAIRKIQTIDAIESDEW